MSRSTPDQDRSPSVVVVDPRFEAYKSLADSARLGRMMLHFRSSGADAIKLSRRLPVDAWLIAPELEDMSGHDLVRLLQGQVGDAPIAIVDAAQANGLPRAGVEQESAAAGVEMLSHPISLADLERLLGMPSEERSKVFAAGGASKAFVSLPVGIGAAAVAIAILMIG